MTTDPESNDTANEPPAKRSSDYRPDEAPTSLYPDEQEKVDAFLKRGVNSVERKPFRPLILLLVCISVVTAMSRLSTCIARTAGVY